MPWNTERNQTRRRFLRTAASISLAGLAACSRPERRKHPGAFEVASRVARHYMSGPDPRLHYADLLTFYGLIRLSEVSGHPEYGAFADRWMVWFIENWTRPVRSFENYRMGGIAGAYRYVRNAYPGDPTLLGKHVRLLLEEHPRDQNGVFAHPTQPGGKIWVDCLMAVCPFLSMAAEVLDRPELHDESVAQYEGMEKALFNESLGLFHQVKNFGPEGCTSTDTWGRGNGWALIGLAELLRYLPKDHPRRAYLLDRFTNFFYTLEPLQTDSGMWRQNLVSLNSYPETSGTGLILYALAAGLNAGWLPERFNDMATRAWVGITEQVDAQGAVHGTCVGTRADCENGPDWFNDRPTAVDDAHSFGPVLLAAVEVHQAGLA